jgi:small subunit ribosomal protein S3Ae
MVQFSSRIANKMAKSSAELKVRKKKWFQIVAPRLFREVVVGESPLYESDQLKGRRMTVNMMNLTGNPKNQSVSVKLRIADIREGKGFTELLGFESMPSSLKRLVRRGKTKVEDSFVVQTSDKRLVRIKPLLVTNSEVAASVTAALRRVVRNSIARLAQKMTYERLAEEAITFKLQKHIQGLASKITPVRNSEIKALLLVQREGVKPIVPGKDVDFREKEEGENYEEEEQKQEAASEENPEVQADIQEPAAAEEQE